MNRPQCIIIKRNNLVVSLVKFIFVFSFGTLMWSCSKIPSQEDSSFRVATPIFNIIQGTYYNPFSVLISCSTPGSLVYYTLDGSNPDSNSEVYSFPLLINSTTTLKALARKPGWNDSNIAIVSYTLKVFTPGILPSNGSYYLPLTATISTETQGAIIKYTMDNSEPSENSATYDDPIFIQNVGNIIIKAIAIKSGWENSSVASCEYYLEQHPIPENFVFVEGGTIYPSTGAFTSGLTVDRLFVDKYEVTQSSYLSVMGSNPSWMYGVGPSYPVYFVDWPSAIKYCNRRSLQEGLIPCYSLSGYGSNPSEWGYNWDINILNCDFSAAGYRLLTTEEWEYVARGGLLTNDFEFSGSNDPNAVAWCWNNSSDGAKQVGTKQANELGIYDMSGNLAEYVWNGNGYSPRLRGGSWGDLATYCSVNASNNCSIDGCTMHQGIRICRKYFDPLH